MWQQLIGSPLLVTCDLLNSLTSELYEAPMQPDAESIGQDVVLPGTEFRTQLLDRTGYFATGSLWLHSCRCCTVLKKLTCGAQEMATETPRWDTG